MRPVNVCAQVKNEHGAHPAIGYACSGENPFGAVRRSALPSTLGDSVREGEGLKRSSTGLCPPHLNQGPLCMGRQMFR